MEHQQLTFERLYNAPTERVWKALTNIDQMRQWYFPMLEAFEPRIGFETEFDVHHNGKIYPHIWKVTEVIENQAIAYSWRYGGYPGNSVVRFALEPIGNQTKLTLTHTFTESFEADRFADFSTDSFTQGWTHFVGRLQTFVES